MPYDSICCPYHQLKYSSPYHSKKKKDKKDTQKCLPFKNWRFRETGQENGPKIEKDKTERATGLGAEEQESRVRHKVGSN